MCLCGGGGFVHGIGRSSRSVPREWRSHQCSGTVATFEAAGINPAVTCIENALWTDPSGFILGSYVKGANTLGGTPDPTGFNFDGSNLGSNAANANSRDFYWVQDNGSTVNFAPPGSPAIFGGAPSAGIVWDLGGQANQAVVFVQVDHGPLPQEVLENTAWLSTIRMPLKEAGRRPSSRMSICRDGRRTRT
jgi:hypothetical protein